MWVGTIRNNTALKLRLKNGFIRFCFGTIRNNTALKQQWLALNWLAGFGTIRNNTALKRRPYHCRNRNSFGTIRNNTALKLHLSKIGRIESFGTIRNNTALKPRRKIFLTKFCNRAICPSQTSARQVPIVTLIIPYFQGSRNSLDPIHTGENRRFSEAQQTRRTVDWVGYTLSNLLTHPLIDRRMHWWKQGVSF